MAERTIYLAGGCFWGVEHLMRQLEGVTGTCVGYANGTGEADATYQTVCAGHTGFKETVRVRWDPERTTLGFLLHAFFEVIDPTTPNRQGNDVGTQYQAGIFWDPDDGETGVDVALVCADVRERTPGFCVLVEPLTNFFPAEDYHQDYLMKNPGGYCHVSPAAIARLAAESRQDRSAHA